MRFKIDIRFVFLSLQLFFVKMHAIVALPWQMLILPWQNLNTVCLYLIENLRLAIVFDIIYLSLSHYSTALSHRYMTHYTVL